MKKYIMLSLMLLAVLSCQKDDYKGVQMSSFPGVTAEIGKDEPRTAFNQEKSLLRLVIPASGGNSEYVESFSAINALSTDNSKYTATVFFGTVNGDKNAIVPSGNISIIVNPDVNALCSLAAKEGNGKDFSEYKDCALIAVSDKGDVFTIDEFIENDILGTMNGLVKWMNSYAERENLISAAAVAGVSSDAEALFGAIHGGYTSKFTMPDQEVAAVACSKKDYLHGNGSVDVNWSVTPVHAFDDQEYAKGDYYIVNGSVAFNSSGMWTGKFTSMHGGVHVRICGTFAREFSIKTYIAHMNGEPVGQYVAGGTPRPTTSTRSTTYSKGYSWNLGGSLTGGFAEKNGLSCGLTLNGGISANKTESRSISDLDIILNQTEPVASYTLKFNNLPHYTSIKITDAPDICKSTATLDFSYIVHLPEIRDYSAETHRMVVKIEKLNYGACRFYSTDADFKDFTWGLNKFKISDSSYRKEGDVLPTPNRIPTGSLKITHDDTTYGKYIFEIKAISVKNPEVAYVFTGSSYSKGKSFEANLPTEDYNLEMKVGDSQNSTVILKSDLQVGIKRGEQTRLNTGGDFVK